MKTSIVKCDLCNIEVSIEAAETWSRWAVGEIHGSREKALSHYLLDVCKTCWNGQPRQGPRGALVVFFRKLAGKAA